MLQGKAFCICLQKPPLFLLQVYSETAGLSIIVLVVVIPLLLGLLLCLRSHLFTFLLAVFTRSGESQGKSFHRNEVGDDCKQDTEILFVQSTTSIALCCLIGLLQVLARLLHIACVAGLC